MLKVCSLPAAPRNTEHHRQHDALDIHFLLVSVSGRPQSSGPVKHSYSSEVSPGLSKAQSRAKILPSVDKKGQSFLVKVLFSETLSRGNAAPTLGQRLASNSEGEPRQQGEGLEKMSKESSLSSS